MSFLSPDTSREAALRQVEIIRAMGPERRVRQVFELNAMGRRLLEAGVRQRHPDWDDEQVRREVIRLRLGDELFEKAFGGRDGKKQQ